MRDYAWSSVARGYALARGNERVGWRWRTAWKTWACRTMRPGGVGWSSLWIGARSRRDGTAGIPLMRAKWIGAAATCVAAGIGAAKNSPNGC